MKKLILYTTVVIAIIAAVVVAQAEDVEVTTPDQLTGVIDSACTQAMQLQSGSQTLCQQIRSQMLQQLNRQLQRYGSVKVDPQFLGEAISWMFNWQQRHEFSWQEKSVSQLVLQLMSMHQYGVDRDTIHDFVLQAEQSGYTTGETEYMCTRLRELMDTQIASEVLAETVKCLKKNSASESSVDDIIDTVQQRIQQKHHGSESGCTNCSSGNQGGTNQQQGNKDNSGSGHQNNTKNGSTSPHKHGGKSGK